MHSTRIGTWCRPAQWLGTRVKRTATASDCLRTYAHHSSLSPSLPHLSLLTPHTSVPLTPHTSASLSTPPASPPHTSHLPPHTSTSHLTPPTPHTCHLSTPPHTHLTSCLCSKRLLRYHENSSQTGPVSRSHYRSNIRWTRIKRHFVNWQQLPVSTAPFESEDLAR
jgi:hypothetical protein